MRVTIINQFYTPDISPTAHLSASLAEGLAAQGHEVTVVASRGGYVNVASTEQAAGENPRVRRVWTPRLGKKSLPKRLVDYGCFYLGAAWRMVRLRRQDVVIALTTPPYIAWTGVFHRWLHSRTKLVLWNMDCYPDVVERAGMIRKGGMISGILRWANRALFRRVDLLVCLDGAMRELLVSQYAPRRWRERDRSVVIPNWEKLSFFPPPGARGARTDRTWEGWERLGIKDRLVVLYSGNMGVGHGFETVLEAAERLRGRPVTFLFMGGGKRWAFVEQEQARRGLGNVVMQPYVAEKSTARQVMLEADCALITLREESLGVMSPSKLHSNLAAGLPVLYVGPKGSNVDEAIERFGCGASVRQGDVEGVVRFVEEALGNPEKLAEMQRRARGAFEAAYCDVQTLPQFEQVLERVAGSPGAAVAAARG